MIQLYPELNKRILEIADGDDDFKIELTKALYNGLIELKSVYSQGNEEKDQVIIQQIRHKMKPTLAMFDFEDLAFEIQKGKEILESEGFSEKFSLHLSALNSLVEKAIYNVNLLLK